MKLLLVGPLPPPLGGATVLFAQLVEELKLKNELNITVINTARKDISVLGSGLHFFKVLFEILIAVRSHDVVGFHASNKGALLFSPFIWLICNICSKPWVFRGFGGYYHEWFQNLSTISRWIFTHTLLKADLVLLETKASVGFFKNFDPALNVKWYSNSRKRIAKHEENKNNHKANRFVFLGHVSVVKGIDELIKVAKTLDDIVIDIYGPLKDGLTEDSFVNNISYKGVIAPQKVAEQISKYDALILPSKYLKEGYPGVLIEAFSVGVPVISTKIGAIPEIVSEKSGILIEPGNTTELVDAISRIKDSTQFFQTLKQGALEASEQFSSEKWTEEYIKLSEQLAYRD